MVLDFPLSIFLDVVVAVSCLDFVSGCAHGEFVNARVGCPSVADVNFTFENLSLGFLQEEGVKVILDGVKVW